MIAGLQAPTGSAAALEQLGDEVFQHGVEDLEQSLAGADRCAGSSRAATAAAGNGRAFTAHRAGQTQSWRIARAHLPRVELVIDVDDKACPCCVAARCI